MHSALKADAVRIPIMLLVFQLRLDIFDHTALDQDIVRIVIKANAHRNIAPCLVRTKMAQTKITDHDGIASIAQANAPFSEACAYSLYGEIADGRVIGLVVDVQELSHFIGSDLFHPHRKTTRLTSRHSRPT